MWHDLIIMKWLLNWISKAFRRSYSTHYMKTSQVIEHSQGCNANQAHLIPTFYLFKVSVMDASYPSITFVMATVLFQGHIVNTVGCPCVSHARLDQFASRSRLTLSQTTFHACLLLVQVAEGLMYFILWRTSQTGVGGRDSGGGSTWQSAFQMYEIRRKP